MKDKENLLVYFTEVVSGFCFDPIRADEITRDKIKEKVENIEKLYRKISKGGRTKMFLVITLGSKYIGRLKMAKSEKIVGGFDEVFENGTRSYYAMIDEGKEKEFPQFEEMKQ